MTAKKIFSGTMPFVFAKLALGGATVLISVVLLAILMGIGWLFGETGIWVGIILWVFAVRLVHLGLMQYVGYLVKAGHIAVIAEACLTGKIPANQVEYGKNIVKERFVTANVYLAVDKLVTGAVKQIQKGVDKAGNALDFIPGMEALTGIAKFFIDISLGYIDECCLGWTLYKKEQGAFQSAADGVVIYAQNWKVLLKNAAKTMVKTILLLIGIVLVVFIPIGLLFKVLKWSGFVAFLLACLIAWVVKFAVMDSYIMIQTMGTYMEVAPQTVITFDLYGGLCKMSGKFKELYEKGKQEVKSAMSASPANAGMAAGPVGNANPGMAAGPVGNANPGMAAGPVGNAAPTMAAPVQAEPAAAKPVFCGQCGMKNEAGTKFCGSCGTKLS